MKRRQILLLALALILLGCSHLRLQCRVRLDGQALPGYYRPETVDRCETAAQAAADEILRGEAQIPALRRSYRLRLRPADGDAQALSEALLLAAPGVTQADAVYINGQRLGSVEDGALLCELLRASILGQMPGAAVFGNISGQLELRRVYTGLGQCCGYDDMILLVTGAAPVIYVDANGRLV